MNSQARPLGHSALPVCLEFRSCSALVVALFGVTLSVLSVTACLLLVVRDASCWMVLYTVSAKSSVIAASCEPLYLAMASYQSASLAGIAPTMSQAYSASNAAP